MRRHRGELPIAPHEGQAALNLAISHGKKCGDNDEPIKNVADDTAVGSCVVPAKNSVKYAPAPSTFELGAATLHSKF